jgi:hypothetical protein
VHVQNKYFVLGYFDFYLPVCLQSRCPLHKVHIYREYHSVCPLVRIGAPHHPLSRKRVCPPQPKGMGTHACGRGGGGSQFRRLEKKISCLICARLPVHLPSCSYYCLLESLLGMSVRLPSGLYLYLLLYPVCRSVFLY